MVKVTSAVCNLLVDDGDVAGLLSSIVATLDAAGELTLRAAESSQRLFVVPRIGNIFACGQDGEVGEPKVNADGPLFRDGHLCRKLRFVLTDYTHKVFACGRLSDRGFDNAPLYRPADDSRHFSNLWEPHAVFSDSDADVSRIAIPIRVLGLELGEALLLAKKLRESYVQIRHFTLERVRTHLGKPRGCLFLFEPREQLA